MIPSSFAESNAVLDPPLGLTEQQCLSLSVYRGLSRDNIPAVVSCWKLTAEELAEVTKTGRVWLLILGDTMPPALVEGVSPFVKGLGW